MIKLFDISAYNKAKQEYYTDVQNDKDDEGLPIAHNYTIHIGLISTILGSVLILLAACIWSPFKSAWFFNTIIFISASALYKYIFGGFGGTGKIISSIKLLLSLLEIVILAAMPLLFDDTVDLSVNWLGHSWLSLILVCAYLALCGAILGYLLFSYVKDEQNSEEAAAGYAFNRFVAGFNSGVYIAFSVLFLIASTNF